MAAEAVEVLVLVKAAPVMTSDLEETMCVAGIRTDGAHHEWARLHPVPFRDLADDTKFKKYQYVQAKVIRHRTDRRPETWTPVAGTIVPGETITSERGWERRRPLVEWLGERTMCELMEANQSGSGPGVPSLGVVYPAERPALEIKPRDPEQLRTWSRRVADAADRPSLFDDATTAKPPLQVIPWRFMYRYRCRAPGCNGHRQTIIDWEIAQLWQRNRHRPDWEDAMRSRLEDDMWARRESALFVGNQEQHPASFLVLGVFWPPAGNVQQVLAL